MPVVVVATMKAKLGHVDAVRAACTRAVEAVLTAGERGYVNKR